MYRFIRRQQTRYEKAPNRYHSVGGLWSFDIQGYNVGQPDEYWNCWSRGACAQKVVGTRQDAEKAAVELYLVALEVEASNVKEFLQGRYNDAGNP